jgi:ABC-2 type transport system permease protein
MNTKIFRTEVRDELLAIVREPTALLFTVLVPVAFFALFATSLWPPTGRLPCCPRF